MIEIKEYLDDLEVVGGGSLLALPGNIITLKFYDLTMKVKFKAVKKFTKKPLKTSFPGDKEMQLDIEVIPENTGALQELYLMAEDTNKEVYFLFRTDVAHNGQVQFTYNIYEKILTKTSSAARKKVHAKN